MSAPDDYRLAEHLQTVLKNTLKAPHWNTATDQPVMFTAADLEAAVRRALEQHESAVKKLWAQCEQVEDACHEHLKSSAELSEHEQGFWRGQKMLAKSIRRSVGLPATDPSTVAKIARGD